jgi:protein transport protein SEC31
MQGSAYSDGYQQQPSSAAFAYNNAYQPQQSTQMFVPPSAPISSQVCDSGNLFFFLV